MSFFGMGSKKRDLSDKSQSGDERKKVREDSMSDNLYEEIV